MNLNSILNSRRLLGALQNRLRAWNQSNHYGAVMVQNLHEQRADKTRGTGLHQMPENSRSPEQKNDRSIKSKSKWRKNDKMTKFKTKP